MPSTVKQLAVKNLITPPTFVPDNIHYETMMGSVAYGASGDASDCDVYGFCIPPKDNVFPHLRGVIPGFGRQVNRFEQFQHHHVIDKDARKEYDITIYSIVKYFQLCMENNPNVIDSLFTPQFCVLHITHVGNLVRDNRKLFLHKGSWHKLKGYAYSQLHKMSTKNPTKDSKRAKLREKFGYDVKFGFHVVRLLNQAEQILMNGDLDLQQNREQLKAIRRGEMTETEIRQWASDKEKNLENLYNISKLQHKPNENKIKNLLLNCLEHHYGNLNDVIDVEKGAVNTLKQINDIIIQNKELLK